MKSRLEVRRSLVAVLTGVLIGGGLMAVTPAGAEVAQVAKAAATNWDKIWKKEIKPKADKRYYTKKKTRQKFAKKSALADFYTKGQSDSRYAAAGSSYTKAESNAKYAPKPAVIRGVWGLSSDSGNEAGFTEIVYPQLAAPPTTHYIEIGETLPVGCSGTAMAPDAAPGFLCIFEVRRNNLTLPVVTPPDFSGTNPNATTFGATIWASATGTTPHATGTYALRPGAGGFGVSARSSLKRRGRAAANPANLPGS